MGVRRYVHPYAQDQDHGGERGAGEKQYDEDHQAGQTLASQAVSAPLQRATRYIVQKLLFLSIECFYIYDYKLARLYACWVALSLSLID
ncbi:hypothetical protein LA080_006018 [Diaporthe eres]|nr:hypothetical protein LA080_006018 [Diaporthe eres]